MEGYNNDKQTRKSSKQHHHNGISSIPDDILASQILVRLPARSVLAARLVRKSWYSLTKTPRFILSHARRARTNIVFDSQDKTIMYRVSLNESAEGTTGRRVVVERETRDLPLDQLMEYFGGNFKLRLLLSCDGLLCFELEGQHNWTWRQRNRWWYWDFEGNRWWYWDPQGNRWWDWNSEGRRNSWRIGYVVCNPVTKDWLNIPRRILHNGDNNFIIIAFYFHSSTGEYRLLGQYFDRNRNIRYEVFSIGGGSSRGAWRPINASPGISSLLFRSKIFLYGSVHFLRHDNYQCIVAFDTSTEQFRKISISGVHRRDFLYDRGYRIIEMGRSLGLCQAYSKDHMDIWCLKDYTKEKWVKQYTVSFEDIINSVHKDLESCSVLLIWENEKELLLKFDRGCFVLYNLESKSFTKKETNNLRPFPEFWVPHIETLVSCSSLRSSQVGLQVKF